MELDELEIVEMELKYCELCGGLWMREQGSGALYCGACENRMSMIPYWKMAGSGSGRNDA